MTPTQQQTVVSYLRNGGICYQEIFDELFDHMMSGIDKAQQQGTSFDRALAQVSEELGGIESIRAIQAHYKRSFEQQYKRWHRRQLWLGLKNPAVIVPAGLIGYALWLVISATLGPNRIQLLLGGFTVLCVAAWSVSLIASLKQYILFKKGTVSTPYRLANGLANRQGLGILCGFLPVLTMSNPSLSPISLFMIWLVCMAMVVYSYVVIRFVNSSYRLSKPL